MFFWYMQINIKTFSMIIKRYTIKEDFKNKKLKA